MSRFVVPSVPHVKIQDGGLESLKTEIKYKLDCILMSKNKEIKLETTKHVEIKLDILKNEELQTELRNLKEVFEASYGPTGRSNFIQHVSGGHVTVTSSSSQILKNITTVSTPLTRLLLQSVQGHVNLYKDGGLFTALLTIQLIESSLNSGLPRHTVIAINEFALTTILTQLESSDPSIKVSADLSNMKQMLCVIRSILATKSATGLTSNELHSLAVLLLHGFINCIPTSRDETTSLDNLRIQECEGLSVSQSCLKKGILLETKYYPLADINIEDDIKVALFDCSLAGNVNDTWLNYAKTEISDNSRTIEDSVLTSMMEMVDDLIDRGVKLIACQKVIHPTLQRYITRKNLYVIERLSIRHIEAVQKLTGATLLSSFQGNIKDESLGLLASMKLLTIHKKRYIHLIPHSTTHPEISTLVLCAPDELGLDELKLVCSAVLQSLKHLLYQPFLVPGAGCFETTLAAVLLENIQKFDGFQKLDCSKQQYSIGLHSVASVFLHLARTLDHDGYDHLVDRTIFHHWISRTGATTDLTTPQHCLCGQVTSHRDTEWYMTEELCGTPRDIGVHRPSTEDAKDFENVVLDVMSMKVNGLKTAFETANTILRVKHFIKEDFG